MTNVGGPFLAQRISVRYNIIMIEIKKAFENNEFTIFRGFCSDLPNIKTYEKIFKKLSKRGPAGLHHDVNYFFSPYPEWGIDYDENFPKDKWHPEIKDLMYKLGDVKNKYDDLKKIIPQTDQVFIQIARDEDSGVPRHLHDEPTFHINQVGVVEVTTWEDEDGLPPTSINILYPGDAVWLPCKQYHGFKTIEGPRACIIFSYPVQKNPYHISMGLI